MSRAIRRCLLLINRLQVCSLTAPRPTLLVRGPRPEVRGCTWPPLARQVLGVIWVVVVKDVRRAVCSALALLVAQVLADHHDPPVTADHLALVADLLDARLNLHCRSLSSGAAGERRVIAIVYLYR